MKTQKSSRRKRLTIVILGTVFAIIASAVVSAIAVDKIQRVQKQKDSMVIIVAQSSDQTPDSPDTASPPENQPAESRAEEKKEAGEPKTKPFKKFRPSEQIEAEQAVDFPYDI